MKIIRNLSAGLLLLNIVRVHSFVDQFLTEIKSVFEDFVGGQIKVEGAIPNGIMCLFTTNTLLIKLYIIKHM